MGTHYRGTKLNGHKILEEYWDKWAHKGGRHTHGSGDQAKQCMYDGTIRKHDTVQ